MPLARAGAAALIAIALSLTLGSGETALGSGQAAAAGISITNPGSLAVTLPEGDDFATQMLGDPADMDQRLDIWFEGGFKDVQAIDGVWRGITSGIDQGQNVATSAYLFPLFQGFSSLVNGERSQQLAWAKVGANDRHAVDTSRYSLLSYRQYLSKRDIYAVYWTGERPVWWPDGSQRFASIDGCYRGTGVNYWPAGWRTYLFDLNRIAIEEQQSSGAWRDTALVRGLRIDPNPVAPAGTDIRMDWVRLTDPSTSPTVTIKWNATGAASGDLVDLWIANDSAGRNWDGSPADSPFISGIPASAGSYTLKTSVLPPGQWFFNLKLMNNDAANKGCGDAAVRAASGWTGPMTIVAAPTVEVTAPSMISGADYATSELGNPWDMSDPGDIVTPGPPYPETLANKTFQDGVFSADASIIISGQLQSDAQLWLNTGATPIDTSRYRYLTIRMRLDAEASKDTSWHIASGWASRAVWWNSDIVLDGSVTKIGALREGWRSYSIDLSRATAPVESPPLEVDNVLHPVEDNPHPAQLGWTGLVSYLRFDPVELLPSAIGTTAQRFYIDEIRLTAPDEVSSGKVFAVRYDSTTGSNQVFYTTDPTDPMQHAANAAPIAAPAPLGLFVSHAMIVFSQSRIESGIGYAPVESTNTFYWNTSGVAAGPYYICVRATDGVGNATIACSDAPLMVR